jgi:hypothetical protein
MLGTEYHGGSPVPSPLPAETSLVERLAAFFRAHPDRWVDGREISRVAGYGGFRSRISDLRKLGLLIVNRQSRVLVAPGRRITKSEYKFVTAPPSPGGAK